MREEIAGWLHSVLFSTLVRSSRLSVVVAERYEMDDVRLSIENDPKEDENQKLLNDKRSISTDSNNVGALNDIGPAKHMWHQPDHVIWDPNEIEKTLSVAPNAMKVFDMVKRNCYVDLSRDTEEANLALLYSSIYGNSESMVFLLEQCAAEPNCKDLRGRTPLHFACCRGNSQIAKVLLDRGADPNRWDLRREATPLHCAASAQSVECILLLLKRKAHINIGLERRSALHFAVDRNAVDCVETLLKYGADPNTPQVYTETPLHTACASGFNKCVELLLDHGADVRSQFSDEKLTALHLAVTYCHVDCVRLLLQHKANVNYRNAQLETPLHIACIKQSLEIIQLLLSHGANVNAVNIKGRTPLHHSVDHTSRCFECCNALVCHGDKGIKRLDIHRADVNRPDNDGLTPLHLAAENDLSDAVFTLIEHGADLTARSNTNESALSIIVRRTPEIIPKLLAKLDASISGKNKEIGDVGCEIELDFNILVPSKSVERGETELLLAFIEVGQKRLLIHPLCESFLFLKWRRIRKFFQMSLIFHAFYVLLFTLYVIGVYVRNCDKQKTCRAPGYISIIGYFVIAFNLILMAKELFQMAHGLQGYAKYWENWLQWAIVFGVLLCVTPEILVPGDLLTVPIWQHHVAAVVVLLVWLELMMLVGRFPIFGIYVQMFTKVAVNFGKFLLAYICLLIAFGLSFSVLFYDYPAFETIPWSILKSVTMMSGELEFEDIFYGDYDVKFPVTAHIIFLSFVLLVTVILTNLMVGLAVSDIQGLQASASLDRLVRQAELVSRLESFFFSRLLRGAPTTLLKLCKEEALLRATTPDLKCAIRPNDSRDDKLPEEIKLNIYKLVAERRKRHLSLRRRKLESNYNIFNESLQRERQREDKQKQKRLTATPDMLLPSKDAASTNQSLSVTRENEFLLRPRSATNVPSQLQSETDLAVKMKNQVNSMADMRADLQLIKEQLAELTRKLDQFSDNVNEKLIFTTEELGRITTQLEQQHVETPSRSTETTTTTVQS